MEVLGHDNVSHNHEPIALASFFENRQESVTAARVAKLRPPVITRAGDKVQVVSAVSTMQSGGHEKDQDHRTIVHRTRPCKERKDGAPTFQNGKEKTKRVGHPPGQLQQQYIQHTKTQLTNDVKTVTEPLGKTVDNAANKLPTVEAKTGEIHVGDNAFVLGASGTLGNANISTNGTISAVINFPSAGASIDGTINAPKENQKLLGEVGGGNDHFGIGRNIVQDVDGSIHRQGITIHAGFSTPAFPVQASTPIQNVHDLGGRFRNWLDSDSGSRALRCEI